MKWFHLFHLSKNHYHLARNDLYKIDEKSASVSSIFESGARVGLALAMRAL
jgi:hypothetical protein